MAVDKYRNRFNTGSKRVDTRFHTTTGEEPQSIAQMHQQHLEQILTPSDSFNEVSGLRDTDDGPYWGHQLDTPALGSSRIKA